MAMGIMAMGTSIGGMLMSPVANWIILHHGWRTAYVFSGTIILAVGVPIIGFVLKARPSDIGFEPYREIGKPRADSSMVWGLNVRESSSTLAFWQIAALMFVIGVVTSGVGAHVVPCLVNDFDYSQTRSTMVWSLTLGVMTFAKFSFGPVSDRWGPKNAMAVSCVLMATAIAVLSSATAYEIALVFAVIYGFGVGAPLTVNPLLVADTLGVKHFGALYGVLNLISIVGAAIGPVALGMVADARSSYLMALYVFVALMALTGVVAYLIRPVSRKTNTLSSGQVNEINTA
jgi:MFS family permease